MDNVMDMTARKDPYAFNGEAYSNPSALKGQAESKKVYIESYGCQMNFSDSEIVASILSKEGFETTVNIEEADLVLLNTCSIRDKAEQSVRNRLAQLQGLKKSNKDVLVGMLGCMAERLKKRLLEEEGIVDLVAGPDAYRSLPELIHSAGKGHAAVNTFLSREETYADIVPVRSSSQGVTAFISIMRGCDNMCSFCVVPFTRGRERSRDAHSIVTEARTLFAQGYREVTLLGQNVDSYQWSRAEEGEESVSFAQLLDRVARIDPSLQVRFSTSHPKDITDEALHTMARHENICKHIHLPTQSGNSDVLRRMNRGYTREWYMNKVDQIRQILGPRTGLSSDIITGFCGETEQQHQDTLSLMDYAQYDFSYMFCYSERPGTAAARKMKDDVPIAVKKRRLQEIIQKQSALSLHRNQLDVGQVFRVLAEGVSKRSEEEWQGRNSANKVVVFPKKNVKKGDYVNVRVTECTAATLRGELID